MPKKVLIVDDNAANLYMLETLLKGHGLEAASAKNGKEALKKARLNPPDMIVSDILMPEMDGYALCREWKADDRLKHIPLVFYTATYTEAKDEEFALSLGAERFVIKPQDPNILMNILKEVLEGKNGVSSSAPLGEEMEFFRKHNKILFRKLEKKMTDLEILNRQLKNMEERYRLILENATDVIYTIDADFNISSMSPSVERILGYEPRDFIGRPVSELVHIFTPESFARAVADIGIILKGGTIQATVYRFIAKDGTYRHGEVSGSPIIREGKIIGLISVARDISDRKQAEEKAFESAMQFEAQYHGNPVPTFTWRKKGEDFTLADFNQAAKSVAGKDALQYLGKTAAEMYGDRPDILGDFLRCHAEKTVIKRETQSLHFMPGKLVIATYAFIPPDFVMVHLEDITERKQAEEKLIESERKYRELYDFLPIPVYEMDLEANITSANRAIYEIFRGTEKDLKGGFNILRLLSPDGIEKSAKNIQRLLQGEQVKGTEYDLKRMDGSVFPAIVVSSVVNTQGRPAGLRGAIIDITELRKAEEDLRRMNAFLDSIVENIPNMIFLKEAKELRFIRFNRAGEDLLGYSRNDLLGKNDFDFFSREQAVFFTEKDRVVLRGKEVVDIPEEPIQSLEKGERILHTKKVPILDANGEPEYLLGISEDITERKKVEDALRQTLASLKKAVSVTIQVMVSAVEARDPYTSGHQTRVADLACAIAQEMNLSRDQIEAIRLAASIHDIGKLSIPAEILSKPTKLTEIEYSLIKEHSKIGYEILKGVESPWRLAEIVLQHHERMNGSGYPRNLKGDEIRMEARIIAVSDVVEAMASHRPYRPGLGVDAALKEIENNRGTYYDRDVADACLRLFRENGYQLVPGGSISYGRIGL